MASSASFWRSVSILLTVLVISQWVLFTWILDFRQDDSKQGQSPSEPHLWHQQAVTPPIAVPPLQQQQATSDTINLSVIFDKRFQDSKIPDNLEGVAVTLMLRAPKWFHRRYTLMLHNILANLPMNWVVQVVVNVDWIQKDVLPLHPGLQKLLTHPRIVWTPLPQPIMTRMKPKEIFKSVWFWESTIAENIFYFSGNGAICGNAQNNLQEFVDYDYVGVPWYKQNGIGGDGSTHSFRHKSAMLRILQEHPPADQKEQNSVDSHYFLKYLLQDNRKYKVADRNTTLRFGGAMDNGQAPLVVSGTQANLNWTARDALLSVCPEVKMIFPSLHEPTCFGAHPNGEKCKASICALRDKLSSSGC